MGALTKEARRRARLQYNPQLRELRSIKKEERQNLRGANRAENAARRSIVRGARQAVPQIRHSWEEAQGATRGIDRSILKSGAGKTLLGSAALQGSAVHREAMAQLAALELQENRGRARDARSSAILNKRSNRAAFRETVADLRKKRAGLLSERSEFTLSELDKMRAERRQAQQEQARIDLARQSENRQERRDAAERRHHTGPYERPGGKDGESKYTVGQIKDSRKIIGAVREAARAIQLVKRSYPGKSPSNQQLRVLLTGNKSQKNPFGGHSGLSVNAAIDLMGDNKITRTTARRLMDEGALAPHIRRLGVSRPNRYSRARDEALEATRRLF